VLYNLWVTINFFVYAVVMGLGVRRMGRSRH
jgi:hypothetical protein